MKRSRKLLYGPRWTVLALSILTLVCVSTKISAQTNSLKIFVKDFSGGLENSQAAPGAPLLDSTFIQNPLFTFMDTVGVDSVTLYFPTWDPADILYR